MDVSLRVLHIMHSIGETSAPYNEHCLPAIGKRVLSVVAFFPPEITPPGSAHIFAGDGTVTGFIRALNAALRAKEYDVIHAHTPHVGSLFAAMNVHRHRMHMAASVFTVHNCYPNYQLRHIMMLLPVFASFRRVVCCSRASFESFPYLFKKLAGERLRVVPNGIDIDRVDRILAQAPRLSNGCHFTVTTISRLVPLKNPAVVLDAYREGRDAGSRLVMMGNGPLRETLKKASREALPSGAVEMTGVIPRNEVYRRLRVGDLFVSASRGEGLPVSVLEAMACSSPVVLSDIAPHREIAAGCDFIPLISADDVDGFTREIRRFRGMSTTERAAIGRKCRALVEERFNLPSMHRSYENIYRELTQPADGKERR